MIMLTKFDPKLLFMFFLVSLFGALRIAGQETATTNAKTVSVLVDSLVRINSETRSAKLDQFFVELANHSKSKGLMLIYCGKRCQYGEVEAHIRGIENKIAYHRYDRNNVVILNAGFRDVMTVELWLVPEGACPPLPNPTLTIKQIKFKRLYKATVPYDCCG